MTIAVLGPSLLIFSANTAEALNDNSQFTPTQLEGYCNEKGGVYFAPSAAGVYACLLPDGTLIACGGSSPGPSCSATRTSGPGRLSLRDQIALGTLSDLIMQQTLDVLTERVEQLNDAVNSLGGVLGELCTAPDLVPLPGPQFRSSDYCQRDDQGRLLVKVHNQGGVGAAASTTSVQFACGNTALCDAPTEVALATPALAPLGGSLQLVLDIPPGCFDLATNRCEFEIAVDSQSLVAEGNEVNNLVSGACGPQFF
jgi:hypothetical protein